MEKIIHVMNIENNYKSRLQSEMLYIKYKNVKADTESGQNLQSLIYH